MSGEVNDAVPTANGEASSPLATVDALAPAGWRGTLARAAVQLLVGTERGAAFYGKLRENMDTVEGRSIVSNALAHAVANQAVNDPDVLERARARFVGGLMQKNENLEAVIAAAAVQFPQLPPPSPSGLSDGAGTPFTESSDGRGEQEEQHPLDPDWAATFTGIAENATTDELRLRLAQVLAGELQSPGAFPRGTLRAISELERSDLEAMRAVLPFVLRDKLVRVSGPKGALEIDNLVCLADAGLILDADSMLSLGWGPPNPDNDRFLTRGLEWGLLVNMKTGPRVDFSVIPLTRTGNAVADLLGRPDERLILRSIASRLNKDHYKTIFIGRLKGDTTLIPPFEWIFPLPTEVIGEVINPYAVGPVTAADSKNANDDPK